MSEQVDLLTVALVRYADACPPETLHPDCPFARKNDEGGRSCNSECRDEITRLSRPGFAGIQSFAGAAYDPQRLRQSVPTDTPSDEWHTGALLQLLHIVNVRPYKTDGALRIVREVDLTNALSMLARRGYDPEWLLRQGFAHILPNIVTLDVCSAYLARDRTALPAFIRGWLTRFEDHVGSLTEEPTGSLTAGSLFAMAQRSGFINYVEQWLALAPVEDVVRWNPVDVGASPLPANDGMARWLIERFAFASLTDWGLSSLHHEYRWVTGLHAPVRVEEMFLRIVPTSTLNAEIARRAVEVRHQSLGDLTRQAIQFLTDGRRAEAAALFDAARILEPSNTEAINNFAFCVTPDDPQAALAALSLAEAQEEEAHPGLNRLNKAVALSRLNRPTEALRAAEESWDRRKTFGISWLWCDWDAADGPKIAEVDGPTYLCELAIKLADESQNESTRELWAQRLEEAESATA